MRRRKKPKPFDQNQKTNRKAGNRKDSKQPLLLLRPFSCINMSKRTPTDWRSQVAAVKKVKKDCLKEGDNDHSNVAEHATTEQAQQGKAPVENLYAGWKPPVSNTDVEKIDASSLTPEEFYLKYVVPRKPVILRGAPTDEAWKGHHWTNEYLGKKVGPVPVKVERRANDKESFGRGVEVKMTFTEFLELMSKGDEHHYLTTQDLPQNEDGRPGIMSSPVTELLSDVPVRPSLMGNLIPQNLNIWFGNAKGGSSTGLHHDFHDNLYVLLRGRKRFRCFCPSDAEYLYTRGDIIKIHPNGRINYEGQPTRADGAEVGADKALDASLEQEEAGKELMLAEEAVENGEPGAEERLKIAEKRFDAAMEAVLSSEMGAFAGDDPADEDGFAMMDSEIDSDEDEEEFDFSAAQEKGVEMEKKVKENGAASTSTSNKSGKSEEKEGSIGGDGTNPAPPSFCMVNMNLPESDLFAQTPLVAKAHLITANVETNEMLYLPAGWFHEVTSFASDNGHMAFNYWFHPPDASSPNFEAPYESDFWAKDWETRPEADLA